MLPAVTQLKQGVNESRLTCNSLGKLNHSPLVALHPLSRYNLPHIRRRRLDSDALS